MSLTSVKFVGREIVGEEITSHILKVFFLRAALTKKLNVRGVYTQVPDQKPYLSYRHFET